MKIISGGKEHIIYTSREVWSYSPHQLKLLDALESDRLKIVFDDGGVVVYYDFQMDD
jgi:formylmethanofuran dehydrogenase subunit D